MGKTGVGKSAVGNTILGMKRFAGGSGSSSVTRRCQKESAVIAHRTVSVVDTPDFFHSTHEEDLVSEIDRSVILSSPGVHAFLYVLKPSTFTEQEAETVSQFKQTYGEEVFRYTVILFTHGDQLQHVEMSMLISQNESLRNLVALCGGRFTVLNNETPADREQVYYLLDIIDRMMSDNENRFYTLQMLQVARRRAEEQREIRLAQEESSTIKHQMDLKRVIRETEIHVRKEMKEELEKARAATEETAESGSKEEMENSAEQELQKRERKFIYNKNKGHYWFILQTKEFYPIIFFSLAFGCLFNEMYEYRWAWVHGCVLGAFATAGGLMTGKTLTLVQRGQFRMSCIITLNLCPNVPKQCKNVFITTCGGLVGSSIMYIGSKDYSVTMSGFLAGSFPAYIALKAHG